MTNQLAGRAGELLVCLDFIRNGYKARIDDFPGSACDVIVEVDNKFIRVQVKTRSQAYIRKETPIYEFHWLERSIKHYETGIDLFAFVALDINEIFYVPSWEIPGRHFSITAKKMIISRPDTKTIIQGLISKPLLKSP